MLIVFYELGRRKWVAEVLDRLTGLQLYKTDVHPRKRDAAKQVAQWMEKNWDET